MNLSAYDYIKPKVDKTKTWILTRRHEIASREFPIRKYVTYSKRYNPEKECTDYFIILLDDRPMDRESIRYHIDDFGRFKVSAESIWYESGLCNFKYDVNINVSLVEHTDDGDIYKLDL